MDGQIRIRILVEDSSPRFVSGFLAEHGLSYWINIDDKNVLFDAGQGMVIGQNAEQLGIDLSKTDMIVLSHRHWDHTGGLPTVLKMAENPKLFMHPDAIKPMYQDLPDGNLRYVGIPESLTAQLHDLATVIWTEKPTEVTPGLFVTGYVPREIDWEQATPSFYGDQECTQPDYINDDQSLFFHTPEGVVLLLGCTHAGVANTIKYVKRLTGNRQIAAIIGGLHLPESDDDRIRRTVDVIAQEAPAHVIACHCTGFKAQHALHDRLKDVFSPGPVGTGMRFDVVEP